MRTCSSTRIGNQQGFTLLALLVALLLLALASNGVLTYVSQQDVRARESELLRVGQIYTQAIGSYYESSPGSIKRWPNALEDLLEDKRFVGTKRHLRQIYGDPVNRTNHWGLVMAPEGGIAGVYSLSEGTPIRTAPNVLTSQVFAPARHYFDWQFIYHPINGASSPRP